MLTPPVITREQAPGIPPPGWRQTLPNSLTASRVLMALVFFVVLTLWRYDGSSASKGQTDWWLNLAAALFIVAGLTDVLDGYLARRWQAETVFGRIMDPFADKILVIGALVFLAGPDFWVPLARHKGFSGAGIQASGIYPWMVVLIVGRELLVTSIRGVLESQGVRFGSDWSGKLKMFCQSVCIPTALVGIAVTNVVPVLTPEGERAPWGRWTIDITVWITVAVTALSGVPYVIRCLRLVAQAQRARRDA
ncbi:MAG: CDP-alcohol phosphatidyltransferase family protein [Phycisphaerales bacterium]